MIANAFAPYRIVPVVKRKHPLLVLPACLPACLLPILFLAPFPPFFPSSPSADELVELAKAGSCDLFYSAEIGSSNLPARRFLFPRCAGTRGAKKKGEGRGASSEHLRAPKDPGRVFCLARGFVPKGSAAEEGLGALRGFILPHLRKLPPASSFLIGLEQSR